MLKSILIFFLKQDFIMYIAVDMLVLSVTVVLGCGCIIDGRSVTSGDYIHLLL